MARSSAQLCLPVPPTWGGRRPGAGRKRTPERRPSVPHRTRPPHKAAHPVHVTLRTTAAVRCLRAARVFPAVRRALAESSHEGFRIIEFSAQEDHLHLLVEAEDRSSLSRGLSGLAIRVARAVNRALGHRGAVWADRYHGHHDDVRAPGVGPVACGGHQVGEVRVSRFAGVHQNREDVGPRCGRGSRRAEARRRRRRTG